MTNELNLVLYHILYTHLRFSCKVNDVRHIDILPSEKAVSHFIKFYFSPNIYLHAFSIRYRRTTAATRIETKKVLSNILVPIYIYGNSILNARPYSLRTITTNIWNLNKLGSTLARSTSIALLAYLTKQSVIASSGSHKKDQQLFGYRRGA